ncbi:MAG: right-handed parallel beta-helix repeat-containing protein [Halobacteriales archaeon]|nr:right-handed parallel beta-helix repeat-containing protein [Halobacteriales archaeon]
MGTVLAVVLFVGILATGSAAGQAVEIDECQTLNTPGQTYELNQSITDSTADPCLQIGVGADDVVLDGKGFTVDGVNKTTGSEGISISANNATVKNFGNVTRWATGIDLDGSNATLTDNTVNNNGGDGIRPTGSSNSELTGNTANNNGGDGINLVDGNFIDSLNNLLTDNTANDNGADGIRLQRTSDSELTDNTANDNRGDGISLTDNSEDNVVEDNTANDNDGIGIHLDNTNGNDLVNNTVFNNGFHGVVLENIADFTLVEENEITDNTGHGLYLNDAWDNDINNNTLVNNDGDGLRSDVSINNQIHDNEITDNRGDGILLRDSDNNTASGNLVENNQNGIVISGLGFGADSLETNSGRIQPESVEESGNTFTDDTSRNNAEWDFVIVTSGINEFGVAQTDPADFPVTNLNIGDSTNPDTTLSFNADNIRLRSVGTPQPDPADAANIGRYFEAESVGGDEFNGEPLEIQQNGGSFLNVSLSYENGDVAGLDESALTLRRFNTTATEWENVPGTVAEPSVNLVSASITQFSDFGAFVEGAESVGDCVNRRDLSRGEENLECPFDRDVQRGGSREGLDRDTGRGGTGEHRDSATERRNRRR